MVLLVFQSPGCEFPKFGSHVSEFRELKHRYPMVKGASRIPEPEKRCRDRDRVLNLIFLKTKKHMDISTPYPVVKVYNAPPVG